MKDCDRATEVYMREREDMNVWQLPNSRPWEDPASFYAFG